MRPDDPAAGGIPGNELLEAALSYARHGWPVLPLHHVRPNGCCSCGNRDCDRVAKHPRWDGRDLPHGLADATTDEDLICRWWHRWPRANIAIATGRRSGFWVLDVDPRHLGDETLTALEREYGDLPHTVETITGGGGRHILFALPADFEVRNIQPAANKPSPLGVGLDLRSEGGYIVAPPSVHANGRRYEWEVDHHPGDVATNDGCDQ
jgi:hypothetical protein